MTSRQATQFRTMPDFVIIGAMKAGTTSLHEYLAVHPQLCMSNRKDTNFFVRNDHVTEEYIRLFADESKLLGETSAGYSQHPNLPGVPERIARANPNAKIIYLVRDPLQRILSHFVHNVAQGRERRTIEAALDPATFSGNNYINTSRYMNQLSEYLAHFKASQILVLESEELSENRQQALREVFGFLKVDAAFTSDAFRREHHRSNGKASPTLLGRIIAAAPGGRRLAARFPFTSRAIPPAQFPGELAQRIAIELQPQVKALQKHTGKGFTRWSMYAAAIRSSKGHALQ